MPFLALESKKWLDGCDCVIIGHLSSISKSTYGDDDYLVTKSIFFKSVIEKKLREVL